MYLLTPYSVKKLGGGCECGCREFICYCCGDACLVLNPIIRGDKVAATLSPSRFLPKVDNKLCDGCKDCMPGCCFDAIEMKTVPGCKLGIILK